jgi:hypothetical protein
MERHILMTISFENLIRTSIHEFIKTYFFDFKYNNEEIIKELNIEEDTKKIESVAIYYAKLSCYYEDFYEYNCCLKAVTCIIASFDSFRNSAEIFKNPAKAECLSFCRDWILFLISESEYSSEAINEVYMKLLNVHYNYENIPMISCNLNKYHKI